jgi:hypothetical protein
MPRTAAVDVVNELGRSEREAIEAGDWDALDEILETQRLLWSELIGDARRDDGSDASNEATDALVALYEVRRRNHALIEQSFAEVRRRLSTAHTGSGARSAYRRTSGRAA